ncbi:PINK1 kinase, partial [Polyodon spathula]|nr:PINK1 kinase [Polyodon spathula]
MSVRLAIRRGLELGRSVLQLGLLKPAARVAAKLRGEQLRLGQTSSRVQPQTFLPGRYRYYRVSLSGLAARLQRRVFWRIPGSGSPRNRAVFLAFGVGLGLIEQQLEEDRTVVATCQEIQALFHNKAKKHESPLKPFTTGYKLEDYVIGQQIGKGCNAAVYEAAAPFAAPWKPEQVSHVQAPPRGEALLDTGLALTSRPARLPLAVKMMWNFTVGSSSESILRAMGQELVAAPPLAMSRERGTAALNGQFGCIRKKLEPHPNVIQVFRAFTADVPLLPGAWADYPDMLPARLNPDGIGHNRTLFLVMKNYPCTLRQSLQVSLPDNREATLLILQLLEGVDHLNRQGIAHRDLKSDNILLEHDSVGCPRLVITDFGCCLAERHLWLKLPFNSNSVDRGGNPCLMAPEVATAVPGPGVVIDYSKADAWAVGAIAYEIFGLPNPFYTAGPEGLESRTYQEKQLPPLPSTVPPEARLVVKLLLRRNANKRPSARVAANLLHICQWGGNLQNVDRMKMQKIADWLLCRAAAALLHAGYNAGNMVEAELQGSFLSNVDLGNVELTAFLLSCEWPWLF